MRRSHSKMPIVASRVSVSIITRSISTPVLFNSSADLILRAANAPARHTFPAARRPRTGANRGGRSSRRCRCTSPAPAAPRAHRARSHGGKRLAQPHVRGDAAGNDQRIQTAHFKGAPALFDQRVHHRILEGAGEVRARIVAPAIHAAASVQHGGLESAEGKIAAGAIQQRARQIEASRAAPGGKTRQFRAARISEPEHVGRLVEGLARGVVERGPEQAIATERSGLGKQCVAAGHQQHHEGEIGRIVAHQRRQQMTFQMIDRQRGKTPRAGVGRTQRGADEQRTDQTGTGRIGDGIGRRRGGQRPLHHRCETAHVIARGQLRHHAAVAAMQFDLTVKFFPDDAVAALIDGNTSLVAGSLNAQYAHVTPIVQTGTRIHPRLGLVPLLALKWAFRRPPCMRHCHFCPQEEDPRCTGY